MPGESDECVVCMSAPTTTTLQPCAHSQLCVMCTLSLQTAACPSCRSPVQSVTFRATEGGPRTHAFPALRNARLRLDHDMRERTVQILVMAPGASEAVSADFVNRIKELFPLVPPARSGLFGSWRQGRQRIMRGNATSGVRAEDSAGGATATAEDAALRGTNDILCGLGVRSAFAPNARVDGTDTRFSLYRLPTPNALVDQRSVVTHVLEFKPDFMLMTCSIQIRDTFLQLLAWDVRLRKFMPRSKMPGRTWVLLAPPRVENFMPSARMGMGHDEMDLSVDLWEGLSAIPDLEERPLTHEVLEPCSWFTRTLKRVASRSVFHAQKRRTLSSGTPPRPRALTEVSANPLSTAIGSPLSGARAADSF